MQNQDKRAVWAERIQEAEAFEGSNLQYCKSKGYSEATFRYWKNQLRGSKAAPIEPAEAASPFLKVEIEKGSPSLPDPRWVAEIILHLNRGLQ